MLTNEPEFPYMNGKEQHCVSSNIPLQLANKRPIIYLLHVCAVTEQQFFLVISASGFVLILKQPFSL